MEQLLGMNNPYLLLQSRKKGLNERRATNITNFCEDSCEVSMFLTHDGHAF